MFPLSGKNDYINVIMYKRINIYPQTEPPANTDKKLTCITGEKKKCSNTILAASLQAAMSSEPSKDIPPKSQVLHSQFSPHKIMWHRRMLAEI